MNVMCVHSFSQPRREGLFGVRHFALGPGELGCSLGDERSALKGLSTAGASLRVRSSGRSMVGQGAFEKAMVKRPGGFGASTAPRFKEKLRDASPTSTSYSPEISKSYIEKKSSASVSGGGFGSTAPRFQEARNATPTSTSYSPELSKSYITQKSSASVSGGGFGASKVSRFEEPKPERFAPPKTGVKPSRMAVLPPSANYCNYMEVLAAIEESVANPPPNEMGMAAADAAWLERNATAEGVVTLPCGLQYKELARGRAGESPLLDTPCECTYESFRLDGTLFDSSFARGRTFDFVPSQMCQGWTVAMQLMGEGDRWELYVPSHMAYGDEGLQSQARGQFVPPGAALVFVLTILKVNGPSLPSSCCMQVLTTAHRLPHRLRAQAAPRLDVHRWDTRPVCAQFPLSSGHRHGRRGCRPSHRRHPRRRRQQHPGRLKAPAAAAAAAIRSRRRCRRQRRRRSRSPSSPRTPLQACGRAMSSSVGSAALVTTWTATSWHHQH